MPRPHSRGSANVSYDSIPPPRSQSRGSGNPSYDGRRMNTSGGPTNEMHRSEFRRDQEYRIWVHGNKIKDMLGPAILLYCREAVLFLGSLLAIVHYKLFFP